MQPDAVLAIRDLKIGNALPLTLIAGPCQMESRDHALEMASAIKEICGRLGIGLVYKSSFDKANRTSSKGARGMGIDKALPVFAELRETLGLPTLTDIHEIEQCGRVAEAVDILQIPAFLCRQTDLLVAAAETGAVVNVKKGQFLAPWDMKNVVAKITEAGNPRCAGDRARRLLRLQHAGLRHAVAADHGADHRRACRLRRDPFGAAAGRAGDVVRRAARVRAGARERGRGGRRRGGLHRDAPGPRPRAIRRAEHGAVAQTSRRCCAG